MIRMEAEGVFSLLEKLARKLEDTAPVMADLADEMASIVEANFTAEGRPKWTPLSPLTIRRRTAAGTWPGKILVEYGTLKSSIETRHDKDRAQLATATEYAPAMQFGTRNIPARPFLVIPESEMPRLADVVRKYLES